MGSCVDSPLSGTIIPAEESCIQELLTFIAPPSLLTVATCERTVRFRFRGATRDEVKLGHHVGALFLYLALMTHANASEFVLCITAYTPVWQPL